VLPNTDPIDVNVELGVGDEGQQLTGRRRRRQHPQ
jgi:hypothetical protein